MNKAIRRLAVIAVVLIAALLANVTYVQAFMSQKYNAKAGNSRTTDKNYSIERGTILVQGSPVAQSVPSGDRYKYIRKYSNGELYGQITGYYSFLYGRAGIENSQDGALTGTGDDQKYRRVIDVLKNRDTQGASVDLTLNAKAQKAAFDALGNKKGAAVALDPKTGAILALVSTPSYDPNSLASHNFDATTKAWKSLNADKGNPMLSRALRQVYPPGSTFKLITAAAAMKSGSIRPTTQVYSPQKLQLPLSTKKIQNENGAKCAASGDKTTLMTAMDKSCNTTFASLGMQIGGDPLHDQANAFGFGQSFMKDELTMVPSRFPPVLGKPQVALAAIGQYDVAVTPMQMAMVAAGIANNGLVMQPYIVADVKSPTLQTMSETKPKKFGQAVSPTVAAELNTMMVDVVNKGTGRPARISGIQVAGKTGTAQSDPKRPPYAWFVAFAPAQNPQIAVAVVIEDASGVARNDISGAGLAAPVAKSMIQAVVQR